MIVPDSPCQTVAHVTATLGDTQAGRLFGAHDLQPLSLDLDSKPRFVSRLGGLPLSHLTFPRFRNLVMFLDFTATDGRYRGRGHLDA